MNPNQIIRLDGKMCFVEVMNDAFPIGKVHLGFYSYDVSKEAKSRITNNIQIYMDIPEFLALASDITGGTLSKLAAASLAEAAKDSSFPKAVFETMGGTPAHKLSGKQARSDGMGVSRQFRINPGTKKPYLLSAESGPGMADEKGLIVPKYKPGQGEHKVMVPVTRNMLVRVAETVRMHIQAYLSAYYLSNPIERHVPGENQPETPGYSNEFYPAERYEETGYGPQEPAYAGAYNLNG